MLNNATADLRQLERNATSSDYVVDELLEATNNSPIINPDAAYLANTTKIDISGLTFGNQYNSITDGVLTVTFSSPIEKRGPVPDGWLTWSSPPFSEDSNPDVLYPVGQTALTMNLSRPVTTFGFELEPSPFAEYTFTADFYYENTLVESITRQVSGNAGARLFARTGEPIDRVEVTGPVEFAIAQIRYVVGMDPAHQTYILFVVLLQLLLLSIILLG